MKIERILHQKTVLGVPPDKERPHLIDAGFNYTYDIEMLLLLPTLRIMAVTTLIFPLASLPNFHVPYF